MSLLTNVPSSRQTRVYPHNSRIPSGRNLINFLSPPYDKLLGHLGFSDVITLVTQVAAGIPLSSIVRVVSFPTAPVKCVSYKATDSPCVATPY